MDELPLLLHYYYLTIASECYQDAVKNISKEYDLNYLTISPYSL